MELTLNLGSRSYSIKIEAAIFDSIAQELGGNPESRFFVISDDCVGKLYGESLVAQLKTNQISAELLDFPEGEASKSIDAATDLWRTLLQKGVDRKSTIVAVGGGVTGDLAGFVAATIMRGIRFVQVPTSLLAQIDSSIGGKVGINLPEGKNIVGAFWQPSKVVIDPSVLKTLDKKHFNNGMAEVIKYGVILDETFFSWIESNVQAIRKLDMKAITHLIGRCCELKAQVVEEDETESTGRRAILNYGHTFGHAIEKVFGYGHFLHGEAIAIGMTLAARLAIQMKFCDADILQRQSSLFDQFDLPTRLPDDLDKPTIDQLIECMKTDKKSTGGQFNLVLPTRIGDVELVENVERSLIFQVFDT